jgi:hypothetical protein
MSAGTRFERDVKTLRRVPRCGGCGQRFYGCRALTNGFIFYGHATLPQHWLWSFVYGRKILYDSAGFQGPLVARSI